MVTEPPGAADFEPPRVAKKTPAAMAAAPPITAIFTQVGENQPPCFSGAMLEPSVFCATLLALDIEKVTWPIWFP